VGGSGGVGVLGGGGVLFCVCCCGGFLQGGGGGGGGVGGFLVGGVGVLSVTFRRWCHMSSARGSCLVNQRQGIGH